MIFLSFWKQVFLKSYKDFKTNYRHMRYHSENTDEIRYATLRMYCHMLDKGLNNKMFEPGHSMGVYNKAKYLYENLYNVYSNDRAYKWIKEILDQYENAQLKGKPELRQQNIYTYTEQEIESYKNFITRRTSCRNFIEKKIPSDVLNQIIDLAIDAPNGCCRQVVRYYITQDSRIINEAIPNIAGITNFTNIPCLVCVASDFSYYEIVDRDLKYIDSSLSVENFMLGASLYGVYGTICNFFHASVEQDRRCRELFSVSETEDIVMFIAIGYPIAIPCKPARRDLNVFYKDI